jgi:hypothetical protein
VTPGAPSARERWTRALPWRWGHDPVVRAILAAFAVVRLLEVATGSPTLYPDSVGYRVRGHFLDFSLTSLGGRSVRPWGVTAWMALWPSDEAIVLAQTALAVLVWSALALTVATGVRRPAARRLVVTVLLVLACTAQVASWDLAILSESVSISTGILTLAAAVRFARAPGWSRAVPFLLAALWFTMTRPNVFPVLLMWAVALLVVGLIRRQVLVGAVVAGLLVAISAYGYAYNLRADPAWEASTQFGVSRTVVAYAYPISQNGPVAEAVIAALRRSDAPSCMIPATPRTVSDHGTTRWVQNTVRSCPGMQAWANAHWNHWWTSWLLNHPGEASRIVRVELPNSLNTPVLTSMTAAVPAQVGSLFFGSPPLPQSADASKSYRTQPLLLWLALAAGVAWVGRRRWRGTPWGGDVVLVAGAVGALGSAISSGLLIQTAPFEVGQESAGVTILMTASLIALVGLGLDRTLASRVEDPLDDLPGPAGDAEVVLLGPLAVTGRVADDAADPVEVAQVHGEGLDRPAAPEDGGVPPA